MSNVKVRFEFDETKTEEGKIVNRLYPKNVTDLFEGEQLVLVGRYKKGGLAKIVITGQVGSHTQSFSFPAKLVQSSSDETYAFVEKLWAVRRIGEIIDEIDLNGKNKELIKELVSLSTKHGILTPYTSFLADDQAPVSELASARRGSGRGMRLAEANLDSLRKKEGRSGFAQRATKNAMQQAQLAAPSADFGSVWAGRSKGKAVAEAKLGKKPGASNRAMYHDAKTGKAVVVETVRNVGQSTLYKRGNVWCAANATDIDLKRDKAKIIDIQRFTPEYFALIRANTTSENAILAQQQTGEELIVRFRSQTYRIK
jgi:Ca-activated chloride channel family protein